MQHALNGRYLGGRSFLYRLHEHRTSSTAFQIEQIQPNGFTNMAFDMVVHGILAHSV